jgi:hypothetical protein
MLPTRLDCLLVYCSRMHPTTSRQLSLAVMCQTLSQPQRSQVSRRRQLTQIIRQLRRATAKRASKSGLMRQIVSRRGQLIQLRSNCGVPQPKLSQIERPTEALNVRLRRATSGLAHMRLGGAARVRGGGRSHWACLAPGTVEVKEV